MTITVEISPLAQRMLDEADEHWSGRHTRDNPLLAEVAEAIGRLCSTPRLGRSQRGGTSRREIRRLLLRSQWHLYYAYQPAASLIEVLAVWYARRGKRPRL